MILYKEWAVKKTGWSADSKPYYTFQGYFLFGIIPLYIRRHGL